MGLLGAGGQVGQAILTFELNQKWFLLALRVRCCIISSFWIHMTTWKITPQQEIPQAMHFGRGLIMSNHIVWLTTHRHKQLVIHEFHMDVCSPLVFLYPHPHCHIFQLEILHKPIPTRVGFFLKIIIYYYYYYFQFFGLKVWQNFPKS